MCCPSGSLGYLESTHTDKGSEVKVGDIEVYETGTLGKTMILAIADVFGWKGGRHRALCDLYASKGAFVATAKILQPPVEEGSGGDGLPPTFDLGTRFPELAAKLQSDWGLQNIEKLKKVIAHYGSKGVEKIAFVGYCYGGWASLSLTSTDLPLKVLCAVSPHPSFVVEKMANAGREPLELAKTVKCPWLVLPAGVGSVEGGGNDGPEYDEGSDLLKAFQGPIETLRFPDVKHGFVTRDDSEAGKPHVEKAVNTIIAFLEKHGAFSQ